MLEFKTVYRGRLLVVARDVLRFAARLMVGAWRIVARAACLAGAAAILALLAIVAVNLLFHTPFNVAFRAL